MHMPVEPPSRPADEDGLSAFWKIVDTDLAPRTVMLLGPHASALADAGRRGLARTEFRLGRSDEPVDLVVEMAAGDGTTVDLARGRVARLASAPSNSIVFAAPSPSGPIGQLPGRWPSWWDDLFAEQGFLPHDVLRRRLWDHPGWNHQFLGGLTLYRRDVAPEEQGHELSLPRNAVHPTAFLEARKLADDAVTLLRHGSAPGQIGALVAERLAASDAELAAAASDGAAARHALEVGADLLTDLLRGASIALEQVEQGIDRMRAEHTRQRSLLLRRASDAERRCELAERRAAAQRTIADPNGIPPRTGPPEPGLVAAITARAYSAARRRAEEQALVLARRAGDVPGIAGKVGRRTALVIAQHQPIAFDVPWWLFDADYFVAHHPALRAGDALAAYLARGWTFGADPHPLFDTEWYVVHNNVEPCGMSPIEHYAAVGWKLGHSPHPLFDGDYYLARYPGVAEAGMNPLWHFIFYGWSELRSPHPLFDTAWYLEQHPELAAGATNPLIHFVTEGWREGHDPSPIFDTAFYTDRYPAACAGALPPYRYYLEIGIRCGDVISPWAHQWELDVARRGAPTQL
jgi:hypothetical protein